MVYCLFIQFYTPFSMFREINFLYSTGFLYDKSVDSKEKDLVIGATSSEDRRFLYCYAWGPCNADICRCSGLHVFEECKYLMIEWAASSDED
jgi:hypothetical protein